MLSQHSVNITVNTTVNTAKTVAGVAFCGKACKKELFQVPNSISMVLSRIRGHTSILAVLTAVLTVVLTVVLTECCLSVDWQVPHRPDFVG